MKKWSIIISIVLSGILLLAAKSISPAMLPLYTVIPFMLMLLSIAVIPLISQKWWHHNYPFVSLMIGLPMAAAMAYLNWHWLYHTALEYMNFIVLLASLFIISGGILIKADLKERPLTNVVILIIGAILANFIGTTGASMLLIRPLIRLNRKRKHHVHTIIFFIFVVGNIGGSLTPLGDPPLFLGFLEGVPFFWTLKLFPAWFLTNALLITIFFLLDSYFIKRERYASTEVPRSYIRIFGRRNFFLLAGVIAAVLLYSKLPKGMDGLTKSLIQASIMAAMALISMKITPKRYRTENEFTWAPIKEVAILFSAIFASMIPALKLLEMRGTELGIDQPFQFFWVTGALSSFLDNAPTYLSFVSLGKSVTINMLGADPSIPVITLIDGLHIAVPLLVAVSMGAVFMGANTYIGNGPNFMIKSVSEESGIKMPSFLGYMLWSMLILIPVFIINTFIFF